MADKFLWNAEDDKNALADRDDAASLVDCTRPEAGDRITAGPGEDRESGEVIDVDGDNVTVAWDQGVTTTQPLSALADLTIHA